MSEVIARQGDTLDLICYRHLGATAGVTEAAIELNPHLPPIGEIVPVGTRVKLPDRPIADIASRVNLWD
jgi:phage tail protein X